MNFLSFSFFFLRKAHHIFYGRLNEKRWAIRFLNKLQQQLGGTTDAFTFSKITNSYAIYIPMVCDSFTRLRQRHTTRSEKERMLYYFICSSLFDNFCDRKELDATALYNISYHPEKFIPENFDQKLFLAAHQFLHKIVQDKEGYKITTQQLFAAQLSSAKQFDPNITQNELEEITSQKGGYAVGLCHYYLTYPAGKSEQECWYQLGGIIQLTNDLYDIYKDLQEGSITLATRTRDVAAMNAYFHKQIAALQKTIQTLPFSNASKRNFSFSMLAIAAFGITAMQQLQALQGRAATLPAWTNIPRKALIVDMEKPSTIFRYIKNMYRLTVRYTFKAT